ncbi:MAG TPA: DHH family phosphoesterase [Verrucomicrobiae bacterium]|nr:DHH family phosphoesterase [Verrucomicrobiae bacterium]
MQRLAGKLFGEEPRLEAYHNHNWRQRPMPEKAAWISDLTFEPRLDRLNWVIVDHHMTDAIPKRAQLIHDPTKSASLLAYELCNRHGIQSPELDRLVHLSNLADLYRDDHPDFHEALDYGSLVKIYGFWNLLELLGGKLELLIQHPLLEVMAVKSRVENPLGYDWSKKHITRISDEIGFVDTVVGNINWIVHQLLEKSETPYPVLLTLLRKGNGTMIVSLRSKRGEAIKLAEKLMGGGHPNAAGATLPRSIQDVGSAIAYLRQQFTAPAVVVDEVPSLESALENLTKT